MNNVRRKLDLVPTIIWGFISIIFLILLIR